MFKPSQQMNNLILYLFYEDYIQPEATSSSPQQDLMGQSKMNNLEILATQGTQDEEKQTKNTTQYVPDTATRKQTQIT